MPGAPEEQGAKPALSPAELPEDLRAVVEKALANLPESKRAEVLSVVGYRFQFFRGPLPPPETLKAYEDAQPGCARRIVGWADRKLAHQHDTERRKQETEHKLLLRGQWTSFAVALAALVGGCVLAALGSPIVGSILSVGSLLGCAALYIRGEFQGRQKPEKDE